MTDRQTDRQAGRQADRQADRQGKQQLTMTAKMKQSYATIAMHNIHNMMNTNALRILHDPQYIQSLC